VKAARRVRREAAWKRPGFTQHEHGTSPGGPPYRSYPRPMPLTSTYAVRGSVLGRRRPLYVRAYRAWATDGGGKSHGRDWWERLR
jgi:hypothetical protein